MKKLSILSLVLLLPGLFYLFLKIFGENEFDVPVYFTERAPCSETSDAGARTVPHFGYYSFATPEFRSTEPEVFAIYDLQDSFDAGDRRDHLWRVGQVHDAFIDDRRVKIYTIFPESGLEQCREAISLAGDYRSDSLSWHIGYAGDSVLQHFSRCGLGIGVDSSSTVHGNLPLVLVDSRQRIRGYYGRSEQKETDRLVLELKILLR
jgi:protein SCO1